jgi:hypothetical protein
MLIREFISEIRNSLRSIDPDTWVPGKFIYSKGTGITALFIKREADDKRLFRYTELWTPINCLEMEEQDLIQCCNVSIPNCKKVMVSKETLPKMYSTRFGYLLNVSSVDYDKDYTPTTPQSFKYTQSREFIDKGKRYFWFEKGRVVIPIVSETQAGPEVVTVRGMFIHKADALKLDSCVEENKCALFMDQEFIAPEHLLQDIKNATVIDILKTNRQIQPDENSDLNANRKVSEK